MLKYRLLFLLLFFTGSAVFAQQQTQIDSLEHLLISVKDPEKPEILMKLSGLYQSISIEKSLEYDLLNAALQQKLGDKRNMSGTLNNIGVNYYMLGDYGKSLDYFEQSLALHEELHDTVNIVKTLNNLGVIAQISGQFSKALDYLQESLIFKLQLKDTLSTAKTLNNIGVIYKDAGNYDNARKFFNQALDYYRILDDQQGISVIYNNLGQIDELEHRFDMALVNYKKSLTLKRITGDERGIGNTLNNIGKIFLEAGQFEKSERYFKEALEIRERLGDKHGIASTLNNSGNLLLKQNQFNKAEKHFLESNRIALEESFLGIQQRNFYSLSLLYERTGNEEKALDFYKQFTATKDTIFNQDLKSQLANLRVAYELEKSQSELELLRRQNQIKELELSNARKGQTQLFFVILTLVLAGVFLVLFMQYRNKKRLSEQLSEYNKDLELRVKERTKELEEANAAKDRFFSIIAHDLRSPFNGLIGFIDLLSDSYDELTEDEKKEFINLLKSSTKDVFRLLENLLKWSSTQTGKLQLNKSLFQVNDIVREIVATNKSVINQKLLDVGIHSNTHLPAYFDQDTIKTVIRNLFSNAVKFTPKNGKIDIYIDERQDKQGNIELLISVEDNGVGITPEHLNNLFDLNQKVKTSGTENETGTGLGLILCKEFVEMNDGQLFVESKVNVGSKFSFTLPVV
ncbi:MAG: tetratricopeptide repeat protein [Candidatus Moranbacteria bacterium]|nr:tetratricopeptide repeat protein [Candidatus Moranbacteria bacterium]